MKIAYDDLVNKLEAYNSGRIFSVIFVKRTTGEFRRMVCRKGVKKGVKGIGMRYDPASKWLLNVYDVQKKDFRMINLLDLREAKIDKVIYTI